MNLDEIERVFNLQVAAALTSRYWRQRVKQKSGRVPRSAEMRVLALMAMTPATRWTATDIAGRCAIRDEVIPYLLKHMQRTGTVQLLSGGYCMTEHGRDMISLLGGGQ